MSDWSDELRFAHHLADVADKITLDGFRSAAVSFKPDGTPVTEADTDAERAMRVEIGSAFPDHRVLGEEEGGTWDDHSGMRWILDPIDGTMNYSYGIPIWGTLIALEAEGDIVCGVVSAPALAERYDAARGTGTRRNGEPVRVSDVDDLDSARLSVGDLGLMRRLGHGEGLDRLVDSVRFSRGLGDFWMHCLVAAGCLEAALDPVVSVWDLAPLLVIVEEAGGRFTDLSGQRRLDGGSCVTTNGRLHDAVVRDLGA